MTSPRKPAKALRTHIDDLRGASRLAIEATQGVCDIVEAMNETIASGPALLGRPLQLPVCGINALVYGNIRRVTRLVGTGIDGALAQLTQLLGPAGDVSRLPREDSLLAILNGVLGDYLQATANPLAIQMQLRHAGAPLNLEPQRPVSEIREARRKLLVLVHGSCLSDRQWLRNGHDHGAALSQELGYTPVYLYYNTGLHTSTNGRQMSHLLEKLVAGWPRPLNEIAILAHSMGGLVSRSACHLAEEHGCTWRKKLRALAFLGTPHHGAPLERGGHWLQQLLEASRYSAPLARLGRIRSAGVTDMRHGSVLDEHWQGRDRFARGADTRTPLPLPDGVACFTVAASKGLEGSGKIRGDGLVPVESALGRHPRPEMRLRFPLAHQWIGYGMGHMDLLDRAAVFATLRRWL